MPRAIVPYPLLYRSPPFQTVLDRFRQGNGRIFFGEAPTMLSLTTASLTLDVVPKTIAPSLWLQKTW